jgi:hypothetical protein
MPRIGVPSTLGLSRAEIERSGNNQNFDTIVELADDLGGGYMSTLELFHQLHCLNVLRKWTYIDYYKAQDPHFWNQRLLRDHTGSVCNPKIIPIAYIDRPLHRYPAASAHVPQRYRPHHFSLGQASCSPNPRFRHIGE